MTIHHLLLIVHLLAATIWVGGHLLLAIIHLPKSVKQNDSRIILQFEAGFEKPGMTSLVLLVASGIAMALNYGIYPDRWFTFASPIEKVVSIKLSLLLLTVLFASSAQFWAIPRLKSGEAGILPMALHIICVTAIGLAMLAMGTFVRFGGL